MKSHSRNDISSMSWCSAIWNAGVFWPFYLTREKAELERWWNTLTSDQQAAIRVVSMDMWRPYRSFVEQHLPQARIVADRFHVMKQLNEQLTKARRKIQREADPETQAAPERLSLAACPLTCRTL